MKILDQVIEIVKKYDLKPISLPEEYKNIYNYLRINPDESKNYISDKNDSFFINKYKKHIPQGWYGFSLGDPIIPEWNEIIDEILSLCIEIDPEFEIHQIKVKFGFVCFYAYSSVIYDIDEVDHFLSQNLYDKFLIF